MASKFHIYSAISSINQALTKNSKCTSIVYTPFTLELVKVLYLNGFLNSFVKKQYFTNNLLLLYFRHSLISRIKTIKPFSRPGHRRYISFKKLEHLLIQKSIHVTYYLNTSRGILSGSEALHYRIGGELLFTLNF